MRIAVDVMGGDHGCGVIVAGAKLALEAMPAITQLYLVGREADIKPALRACACHDPRIQTVNASQVLTMEDKPVVGIRHKKDCSILKAVELIKAGAVEAIVSPGNTGGVVAASTIRLRPLEGVDRPGIAAVMPAPQNEFVLIDAGANVECKPIHLLHYAIMGSVYSQEILGYKKPRVGLLSVGTEEIKGNELTLEAFKLCKRADINFIGNIEGYHLFANRVDVVVCDGFVGNIVLKTCEGLAKGMFEWLKSELTKNTVRKAGAYLAQEAFRAIKRRTDADTYGGAPLLGLKGNVMIAHGSARENAIMNAIRVAAEAVQNRVNQIITEKIAEANSRLVPRNPALSSPALA
jgi:glycerol-3-phosphate acyltransferase PlsX